MKYKHFSIEEREKIQELVWQKLSIRKIAGILGRSHSSVVRELRKSSPERRSRGRKDRLKNKIIREYVVSHLKQRWSPEQISGRMNKESVGSISHEAIYQFIYAQIHRDGWGLLRSKAEDFRMYLRRKRKRRVPKGARRCQRIFRPKGTSIEDRPIEVNKKERIGDWEGDTVESCDHKPGVNTLLERKTGLYLVTKVRNKTSLATIEAMKKRLLFFKAHTITLDNGPENSDWQRMEKEINIKTFFAHPYRSCERGANENSNGLLREYFPKKTDFTRVSDEEIQKVEYDLNTRPRKRLNWSTPLEVFSGATTD